MLFQIGPCDHLTGEMQISRRRLSFRKLSLKSLSIVEGEIAVKMLQHQIIVQLLVLGGVFATPQSLAAKEIPAKGDNGQVGGIFALAPGGKRPSQNLLSTNRKCNRRLSTINAGKLTFRFSSRSRCICARERYSKSLCSIRRFSRNRSVPPPRITTRTRMPGSQITRSTVPRRFSGHRVASAYMGKLRLGG
jgi:hypothetical protein